MGRPSDHAALIANEHRGDIEGLEGWLDLPKAISMELHVSMVGLVMNAA
jgi:hypothetical protein